MFKFKGKLVVSFVVTLSQCSKLTKIFVNKALFNGGLIVAVAVAVSVIVSGKVLLFACHSSFTS